MKTNSRKIFLAFCLGIMAGAAAMFCAGLLYLRHNLVLRGDYPGVTAGDLDDALENEFPAGTGWHAVRENVSMPLPRDGRPLFHSGECDNGQAGFSVCGRGASVDTGCQV